MELDKVSGEFQAILHIAARNLSDWLQKNLPDLDANWWASLVLPTLSFAQKQRVDTQGIDSLDKLDLAALLKVFDQNWYHLSQVFSLTNEERHFVKEMRTIRNRWAHLDVEGIHLDDVYRDVDTLDRFLDVIDGKKDDIDKVKFLKRQILKFSNDGSSSSSNRTSDNNIEISETSQATKPTQGEFSVGSLVALNSDPSKQGAIVNIEGQQPNSLCKVFVDGKIQPFYLSQLHLVIQEQEKKVVSLRELHSLLTCLQIKHPSLSTLYSLNAARIDFVPYQFRPALKIIQSDQPRLLIADGVGVGKTIEAGLVLRELQARNDISSVLVICPKPLVAERKWELELKRFDERFTHLDGKTLRFCVEETDLEGEWPNQHSKTILPYSLLDETLLHGQQIGRRSRPGLVDLDPPPHFDLVIVDEAHHIRNTTTFAYQAVRYFCENAEAILFLTATPIQLGNQDLYTLLNLLRPDIIIDQETFIHMSEPNPFINDALSSARGGGNGWQQQALESLATAGRTSWGASMLSANPVFNEVLRKLTEAEISRKDRVAITREIESFHSFSRLINRTRRKDIGSFCIRRNETVEVEFTNAQRELHDEILRFEATSLSMLHGTNNVNFMMSTIRRQAASCIFGLAPMISDILDRRLDKIEGLTSDDDMLPGEDVIGSLTEAALEIVECVSKLPPEDPKYEAFLKIIEDKQSLENNKLMVFSTFRHTLTYLEDKLENTGVRVGLIHGGVKDDERLLLRRRFELSREDSNAIDVMLFSEVGCEGLDYQFCDVMINYDLPWNPMRIEQRIGRIDRRGQKSDVVVIYNLITPGTVDADIYNRCLLRIGIFEESIGDCEEILGDIHKEIRSIAENLDLSDEDRNEMFEQLADNEVRHIQEQRSLENREHELFGIRLPKFNVDSEVLDSESFWLSPMSIQRFVTDYLNKRLSKGEHFLGDKQLKTLRLSREARSEVLADYRKLPINKTPMYRNWEKWLKDTGQHCNITFDSQSAADNRDAHFIMPLHPLVLQAAMYFETAEPVYTALRVTDLDLPQGKHLFVIYAWEYKGIRPELKLIPVCSNSEIQENFFDNLEAGVEIQPERILPQDDDFDDLDTIHHSLWLSEKDQHIEKTQEICRFRQQSLETSHRGRVSIISEQIASATNEKIRRMKESQLNNTEADYDRKVRGLKEAESYSDIYARPVVFGVIKVETENGY